MPQLASPSRPSRLHVLIAVLAVALPSAAVGAKSDELLAFARAQLTDESPAASDPSGSKRGSRTPSQQARAQPLPRQAQAIREALDLELPPGAEVELVARLGVLGDATDEARLLSLSEHEEYRIRSAAIEALGRLGTPRAVDRLAILAASMDSRLNYQATRALGLSAAPEAAVVLQELAEHPVPRRREVAITALSVRGGPLARSTIHRAFARAGSTEAWVLADALVMLGSEADHRLLVQTATRTHDPRSPAALESLASLSDPDMQAILLDAARSASGSQRVEMLGVLGGVRDPEAVELLLEAWHDSARLRPTVLSALSESRAPGALDAMIGIVDTVQSSLAPAYATGLAARPERTAREVLRVLAAEEGPLAEASLGALAQVGDPEVTALLVARLDEGGRLPPVESLAYLATHGGDDGWELLEEVLAEGTLHERDQVIWALRNRGDEDAALRLLDLVRTGDTSIEYSALNALETMGGFARDGLREILMERMDDPNEGASSPVTSTLARLGGEGVTEVFMRRIEGGTAVERLGAISGLGELARPEATAALEALMLDEDPSTRHAALSAMTHSSEGVLSLEVLDRALADEDLAVRRSAVTALGVEGSSEAAERLLALASEGEAATRSEALSVLARQGGDSAEEALLDALSDPEVSQSALWGLREMGSTRGSEAIRRLAKDEAAPAGLEALAFLGYDHSAEAGEILSESLSPDDPVRSSAALAALQSRGNSGSAVAIAELFDALPSDDPAQSALRWEAGLALQNLGGPEARERLEEITEVLEGGHVDSLGFGLGGGHSCSQSECSLNNW